MSTAQILLLLLAVLAAVAFAAARLKVPSAILLVFAGVILALVPGLPAVAISPEFVLLIVLPPIIYSSAVAMSWKEFLFNLRPIALLAVGCVVFTATAIAAVAHFVLGLSWALGFVLGAIVSPPDAVAPLSIARRMGLPRRILVILEGEGLVNDATALILYRFAVTAVSLGVFSFNQAVGTFAAIVAGELVWGMAVGWMMLRLRNWMRDPRIEITLSVLTPFIAYWVPEHLGGSGVLATVTAGLYISWNGLKLISAPTRLQGVFFWGLLIYLTEGLIFLVTGLQARTLLDRLSEYSLTQLATSALIVCAMVIVTRFVWIYPATYLPRRLSKSLARNDPAPPWQWPFVLSFTGIRGIVSLAAALAIPLTLANGEPFPGRDLVLFLTYSVILVTLVGQGLLLPLVIRWLGLANAGLRERKEDRIEEFAARREAIQAALARIESLCSANELSEDALARLRATHEDRLDNISHRSDDGEAHQEFISRYDSVEFILIEAERERINELYRAGKLKDEARRRIERELDLRHAHLTNLRAEG